MKTQLILFSVLFAANVVFAQDGATASGIYLTKQDFLANNVSHLAKNDGQNSVKIGSNQTIVLKKGREREKFRFKDIYGYSLNGERYRKFGAIKFFRNTDMPKL